MRKHRAFAVLILLAVFVFAASACGGGGQGLRLGDNPVRVTSTTLPPKLSGETLP